MASHKEFRNNQFKRFIKNHPDFRLKIIVSNDQVKNKINHQLIALQLEHQVDLFKNITDRELRQFYQQAMALIYVSIYEGFGYPILEAQACGCQVITSNLGSMKEIGGQKSIYIDPNDTNELIKKLIYLVKT